LAQWTLCAASGGGLPASSEELLMDRRVDLAIAAAVAAFGVFVLVVARDIRPFGPVADPMGPAAFPQIVGVTLVLGGAALVCMRLLKWGRESSNLVPNDGEEDEADVPASAPRAFALMGASLAYAITMPTIGYVIGTVVYVTVALRLLKLQSWIVIGVIALIYMASTYLVFTQVVSVRLPVGPLLDFLRSLGLAR
jgi:putative tricarboxylic transport membrane protein